MKLGDFLNTLAQKSNTTLDFSVFANVKLDELNKIEIDDTMAQSLDTSLMSLDGAKNNPAVLNHYKPIILKAVDDKMAIIGEKFGLGEDFTLERNTYKRTEMLENKFEAKIKELEAKQGTTGNKEKEAQLTQQLTDLQTKLSQLTDSKTNEIGQLKNQYENEITEMFVKNQLSSVKYATKDLPIEVNLQVARTLLDSHLKQSGAKLVRVDGELKLVQAANPEMAYVDSGFKPVSFNDFTNKVLADSKLLEVSTQQTQQTTQQQQTVIQTQQTNSSKFEAAMADALK